VKGAAEGPFERLPFPALFAGLGIAVAGFAGLDRRASALTPPV
jgi:hypothetical protein